jgi:hypothetical protein
MDAVILVLGQNNRLNYTMISISFLLYSEKAQLVSMMKKRGSELVRLVDSAGINLSTIYLFNFDIDCYFFVPVCREICYNRTPNVALCYYRISNVNFAIIGLQTLRH